MPPTNDPACVNFDRPALGGRTRDSEFRLTHIGEFVCRMCTLVHNSVMPISDPSVINARLSAIHNQILDSNDGASLYFERVPDWYSQVLSRVDVLTNGQPLAYLTSSLTSDPYPSGEMYAYTDRLVVHTRLLDGASEERAEVEVRAWSRDTLRGIKVTHVRPLPERPSGRPLQYPDFLRLELQYSGDDDPIQLPVEDGATRAAYEGGADLLPSLLDDLERATAG